MSLRNNEHEHRRSKMKKKATLIGTILVLGLLVFGFAPGRSIACEVCGMHGDQQAVEKDKPAMKHQGMKKGHDQMMQRAPRGMMDKNGMAMGATMDMVLTADSLFTCPMHPEVVTDNREAKCPLCHMNLKMMEKAQVDSLRASHPKGCPMDPIVVAEKSKMKQCPICKMKLQDIQGGAWGNPGEAGETQ